MTRAPRLASMLLALAALVACASGPTANPRDPLEPLNRGIYQFNDAVDVAVLTPVATAYQNNVPRVVRLGIGNFFGNIEDAWSFVNNALQLKGVAAGDSFFRFAANTVFGLGGILDVASEMRIEKHTKDFGHTLGYWGLGPGPYMVLPFFGPSTLRDTAALPVDMAGDLVSGMSHIPARNSATVVRLVDKRAGLLKTTAMLEQVALDKYSFVRDAYLQSRRSAIFDGNPPEEESNDTLQDYSAPVADVLTEPAPAALNTAGVPGEEKAKP
jgi:phospholipid-binding lipoprotein MlaA